MGLCDIQDRSSNKKNKRKKKQKNKTYTPHHTISHKHTLPKSRKQVKTDENSSPAGRLRYTWREHPRQRHDTARQSRKTSSRTSSHPSPYCFHFTYFVAYTDWRTRHHPASVMISSHSVSLHDFILNKTSYATEYFVCPHQLRFHNSLSNSPTSYFMPMGGRRIAVPHNL